MSGVGSELLSEIRARAEAAQNEPWYMPYEVSREAVLALVEVAEEALALVVEAYDGDTPSNAWRSRAEALHLLPRIVERRRRIAK